MSRGLNKVQLIGHLGRDPEVRSTNTGLAVANATLATNDTRGKEEHVEWHRLVFFGKGAELARDYAHKGDRLYVEGRLQTREWEGKDGQKRQATEIVVDQILFLGGGRAKDSQPEVKQEAPAQARLEERQDPSLAPVLDEDDDLPF
jgi:single-strand DNA-binding protein